MKSLKFLLLAVILLIVCACANESYEEIPTPSEPPSEQTHSVTPEKALSELDAVFAGLEEKGTRSGGGRPRVASMLSVRAADVMPITRAEGVPDVEDVLFIGNFENDEGYAILAADDRLVPVMAVTEQGNLTLEQFKQVARGEYSLIDGPAVLPEVVDYAIGLGGDSNGGIRPPTKDIDTGDGPPYMPTTKRYGPWVNLTKVSPLVWVKWGQREPYNYYTPSNYPVGCVAVALGQIITSNLYNAGKKQYTGKIGNYVIYWPSIFSIIDIFVQNPTMKRIPEDGIVDKRFNFYMPLLLREIGREVDMSYSAGASGATDGEAKRFLNRIGYDNVDKSDATESNIRKMLVDRRFPVYIGGRIPGKFKGHAWVIDGLLIQQQTIEDCLGGMPVRSYYQQRALYHCNFGWYGQCDGYYYFHAISKPATQDPALTDDGDVSASTSNNYSSGMKIITYTGL